MKTHNINPYYDDFDELKNFHQILFRPGYPVQARELTQLQSILKNQIEKFGNHIFQQGSIVIPGNSRGEIGVSYVKVEPTFNSLVINPSDFLNKEVIGQSSGVKGIIKTVVDATDTDPITFYISYTSGGVIQNESNGKLTFDSGEDIQVSGTSIIATVKSDTDAIGVGSIAHINQGVYYVNGTFVTVATQSMVIDKYDVNPSCHVLLKIIEEYIDSDIDSTLLDPAQGSYNFAAPGANRYKISLELVTLPLDSAISDNYVEIMRYESGVLVEHARTPKYNELEKSLARRTYDESGDYVVSGLNGTIREHLRESNNGGLDPNGLRSNYVVSVSPGKAYIKGFEIESIANTNIVLPKARTSDHVKFKEYATRIEYGQYIYVSDVKGNLGISTRTTVDLYNDNDPTNGSATKVGTCKVASIDYYAGAPDSLNTIYILYIVSPIFLNSSYSLINVGGIRTTNGSATVVHQLNAPMTIGTHNIGNIVNNGTSTRTATVKYWNPAQGDLFVYKHSHTAEIPLTGERITNATTLASADVLKITSIVSGGQNSSIFELPVDYTKSIKNETGFYDHQYVVQKQLSITTNSSGTGSVTISSGVIRPPEVGTFSAFNSSGPVSVSLFALNVSGDQLSISGGPASSLITISCVVEKDAVVPRTKTLTTAIETVTLNAGATKVSLSKPDAYRINSISHSSGDVTGSFTLDNGQTDYEYLLSGIRPKTGVTLTGTLNVTYEYFQHSDGDFFCVDSYAGNTGYEDFYLIYESKSTGKILNLKNCIDTRPSVNSSGTYSGGGAVVGDSFIDGERFSSTLQYYVPRIDVLVINKDNTISVIQGIPSENPVTPKVPSDVLSIESYFVPAYTESVIDILLTRYDVNRSTMRDIAKLKARVDVLEKFSTLSASESALINTDVVDEKSGLVRFKTGYLVENFKTPLTIADTNSSQFMATFDGGKLKPSMESMLCPVDVITAESSGYTNTNGFVTLPYTEKVFATQGVSSRITNLNPFLVISWDGTLRLTPNSDSWIETFDLPEIFNRRTETVTVTRWVPSPIAAPVVGNTQSVIFGNSNDSGFDGSFDSSFGGFSDSSSSDSSEGSFSGDV